MLPRMIASLGLVAAVGAGCYHRHRDVVVVHDNPPPQRVVVVQQPAPAPPPTTEVITTEPAPATEVIVAEPPPPPPVIVETRTVCPHPGWVWCDGYHAWRGGRYVWVAGRWGAPPRVGARWVVGHWEPHARGRVWIEGRFIW